MISKRSCGITLLQYYGSEIICIGLRLVSYVSGNRNSYPQLCQVFSGNVDSGDTQYSQRLRRMEIVGSQDQKHERRKSQQTAVWKIVRASDNLSLVKKKSPQE